jgi:NadR type nicotinamide-nucleotide adenylyltransferase
MAKTHKRTQQDIIKVVFFGPESTGKTTLAKTLAKVYQTTWVPEFARDYLQVKFDKTKLPCEAHDLLPIGKGQLQLEQEEIQKANKFLFCDTNVLETYVYSKIYFPKVDFPELEQMAAVENFDYYFLTDIDVPWVKDDLRDKPNERQDLFKTFKDFLIKYDKKFVILRGSLEERIATVKRIIDN